jgi:hypothetical protein
MIREAGHAARRLRLLLDTLDERERLFTGDGDFFRFGRNLTGALGIDCSGAVEDSAAAGCGAGGDVTTLRDS